MSRTYRRKSTKAKSTGCQNHGSCSWCLGNRTIGAKRNLLKAKDELITRPLEGHSIHTADLSSLEVYLIYHHDSIKLTSGETEAGSTTGDTPQL